MTLRECGEEIAAGGFLDQWAVNLMVMNARDADNLAGRSLAQSCQADL